MNFDPSSYEQIILGDADLEQTAHAARRHEELPWPDIGHLANWSVSSFKYGFGSECLRDGDPDTFWHSDGPQPHSITVEFPRKVAIQKLSINLSFTKDDSYTPSTLTIRAGTSHSDIQDVRVIPLEKPEGWVTFDISAELLGDDDEGYKPIHAYILQVVVLSNHMSGKDTHVRGMRILAPNEPAATEGDLFPWTSQNFKMFQTIR